MKNALIPAAFFVLFKELKKSSLKEVFINGLILKAKWIDID
jgi:hypothetical protein